MDHKYKVVYFDLKGRAEIMRFCLWLAGATWEDDRIQYPTYMERKERGEFKPFDSLPLLIIDDSIKVTQSLAIFQYLGKMAGLVSADALEDLFNSEIHHAIEDVRFHLAQSIRLPDEEKMAARKKIAEEFIPRFFGGIDSIVGKHGKRFAVRDEMSTCDLDLYLTLAHLQSGLIDGIRTDCMDKYSNILRVADAVKEDGRYEKYVESTKK